MAQIEKHIIYAQIILEKIQELFDEDNESLFDKNELLEGDNATHFMHALATLVPNVVYNKLSGDKKSNLEFNHFSNHLCFQYSTKDVNDD